MDYRITIMAAGYSIGTLLCIGLGFFVWFKMKRSALSTIFLLMNLSIAVVSFSIMLMVISTDIRWARLASLLNNANILLVVFMAHWCLEIIGISRKRLIPLALIYAAGIASFIFFLISPSSFMLEPVPKLYLNFYFEPALWYDIMRIEFTIVTVYFLYELFRAYRETMDNTVRNRLKYVFSGILFGMVTGHIAMPLVYDIPIDPLFSMLFPLYTIPFAYAIVHYELMDIKIIARRAVIYALSVSVITALLAIVTFSHQMLTRSYPGVPVWFVPVLVSLLASSIGFFVWRRLKEEEILKYEFITIVTHKFRTPLTQIKWSVENIMAGNPGADEMESLKAITRANVSLVELTNTLVGATENENVHLEYDFEDVLLDELVRSEISFFQKKASEKNQTISFSSEDSLPPVNADRMRLGIVIQTLLENAMAYTPDGGNINVSISENPDSVVLSVRDTGIGISRDNIPRIFTKMYRSEAARNLMTEGMGIGLYVAKQIIDRHGGRISVASEGEGKGSAFTLELLK